MRKKYKKAPADQSGDMLNQKTNEDFNNKRPDPSDPNEQRDRVPKDSSIDGNGITPAPEKKKDENQVPDSNEGSE